MAHGVGSVAALAGITVRTLHHYDAIGLLTPSERTRGGHRTYTDDDLKRLQQILFYRELGFGLDEIAALLADGNDTTTRLRRQRDLLAERARRLQDMADAVEAELQAEIVGVAVSPAERLAVFGRWRPPTGYADEAQQRWGATPQWAQAREKMSSYSAADLQRMQDETAAWVERLRAEIAAGTPADAPAARQLAEELYRSLRTWWFDCDPAMFATIAARCATEPDQLAFLVRPDRQLPGMGPYISAAAQAFAGG